MNLQSVREAQQKRLKDLELEYLLAKSILADREKWNHERLKTLDRLTEILQSARPTSEDALYSLGRCSEALSVITRIEEAITEYEKTRKNLELIDDKLATAHPPSGSGKE